jgi:5'(3')-deoxyribonucleotidase
MNIGFDLDEVLVNLSTEIKKIFKKQKQKYLHTIDWNFSNYPNKIRQETFKLFEKKDIMCKLRATPLSKLLINTLKENGNKVIVITARNINIKDDTIKFVKRLFKVPCYVVGPDESKLDILEKEKIDIWVDDCPKYLEKYEQHGIKCIMISNKNTVYNHYLRNKIFWCHNVKWLYNNFNIFNTILEK